MGLLAQIVNGPFVLTVGACTKVNVCVLVMVPQLLTCVTFTVYVAKSVKAIMGYWLLAVVVF